MSRKAVVVPHLSCRVPFSVMSDVHVLFWRCPKSGRLEAPGHWSPWRPPRRLWKSKTLQPRRGLCVQPCAAAFRLRRFFPREAVGRRGFGGCGRRGRGAAGTTEVVGSWVPPVQSTNGRWMFWTQHLENCSRQKAFTKHTHQFSIHLSCKWHCLQWNDR